MGVDGKGSKENNLTYIYTIVEAQSVVELVKLTNLKTKKGWKCLGGMCFISLPGVDYPYCQSLYKIDKIEPEDKNVKKKFTAFPYKGETVDSLLRVGEVKDIKSVSPPNKNKKRKAFKFVVHPLKKA